MLDLSNIKFGRIYSPDPRDAQYPLSDWLPDSIDNFTTDKMWWDNGWWGNQGQTPMCVAFSWSHWLEDGPVVETTINEGVIPKPMYPPPSLYATIQSRDPWAGTPHDGSTVRAGANVLKRLGWIKEYRWAQNINDVIQCLLTIGPFVVGTSWYTDMFNPNEEYIVTPTGSIRGGHAYVLNGIDTKNGLIRIKNSWGQDWGMNGHAFIRINDFEKLLSENGEACCAWKNELTAVPPLNEISPVPKPDPSAT